MPVIPALLAGTGVVLYAAWAILGRLQHRVTRQIRPLEEVLAREATAGPPGQPVPGPSQPGQGAPGGDVPALSVVVAARDEAGGIERMVRGILAQRGAALELIVVDDRSTDATGAILDRIAADPAGTGGSRLTVIHNRDLPDGWLGKCHACHLGAGRARGEWILFTDGDAEIERNDLLARVVAHAERLRLDHVAVIPDARPMPRLQVALMLAFARVFLLSSRAWEIDRDLPRGGIGIGAFNLVRRSAYDRIGGHTLIKMDPVDDLKLGRLLKESGARQRVYDGVRMVRCPWHRGALRVVRGLEKNLFAGLDYSVTNLAGATFLALALCLGPVIAGALGALSAWPDHPWLLAAACIPFAQQASVVAWSSVAQTRRYGGNPVWLSLLYPAAEILLLGAAWNSAVRVLARGGVRWRGTFYPLPALRRGLVPAGAGRRMRR
ncbi:MAG: glycosyltransferase [Acidobacteria bacterium]|nr:glycosyltransferase [Acidobacteriota bacterium]